MPRILIVDDEKPIVDVLKFNLEKDGYKTIEAYDGEQAIERAGTKAGNKGSDAAKSAIEMANLVNMF